MAGSASDKPLLRPHIYSKQVKKRMEQRFKDHDDPMGLVIVATYGASGSTRRASTPGCATNIRRDPDIVGEARQFAPFGCASGDLDFAQSLAQRCVVAISDIERGSWRLFFGQSISSRDLF